MEILAKARFPLLLRSVAPRRTPRLAARRGRTQALDCRRAAARGALTGRPLPLRPCQQKRQAPSGSARPLAEAPGLGAPQHALGQDEVDDAGGSEEHTSELQSLMRIPY